MLNKLLSLENPSDYICRVIEYSYHGRVLTLEISGEHFIRANFAPVFYFSGPMEWKGAHFRLGETHEALRLLDEVSLDEDTVLSTMQLVDEAPDVMPYRLYIATGEKAVVQILSGKRLTLTRADGSLLS